MHTFTIGGDTGRSGLVNDQLEPVQQFAVGRGHDAKFTQLTPLAGTLAAECNWTRRSTNGVGWLAPTIGEDAWASRWRGRCGDGGHF